MGRDRRTAPGVGAGDHAKERHKRDRRGNLIDWSAPLPPGLVARPEKPKISSKHKSWFEFIENKDKKKKLEFEFTEKREPPPGFEFVPIGNPALTTACKELSREQGAMIFIVTASSQGVSKRLSLHLNRVGHHIRQTIVEQARASLGDSQLGATGTAPGEPEPIPEKQEDINRQADAAIRDLFPRIPNTDRQAIIEHAFNKSRLQHGKGDPPVGLAPDVTLSRRVQLAVLAHIRHNHTRYDQLLRETSYVNARKAVESLCLDILVKWRGDEETGRDQLDEILCEVVVISDSESDESDNEEEDGASTTSSADESSVDGEEQEHALPSRTTVPSVNVFPNPSTTNGSRAEGFPRAGHVPQKVAKPSRKDRRAAKWAQRGFHRYQAARDQAWHQAVERQRLKDHASTQSTGVVAVEKSPTHRPQPWRVGEPALPDRGIASARSPVESSHNGQQVHSASYRSEDANSRLQRFAYRPTYPQPQEGPAQQDVPDSRLRPIVGSRTLRYGTPETELVSYHGQDFKDYPVPSIEPTSPQSSNVRPPLSFPYRHRETGRPIGLENPVRVVSQHHGPAGPQSTAAWAPRPAYADSGFIRLPPRFEANQPSIVPDQHLEPFIVLNSQSVSTARGTAATATSGGLGVQPPSLRGGDAAPRGEPAIGWATRPIWIGHDGVILRSEESRPIVIPDYPSPPRQARTRPVYVSSEHPRASPTGWTRDARHPDPSWADERDRRHADSRNGRQVETLQDDVGEFVRVKNKFPRQHEPRPIAADDGRYDLQTVASQQGLMSQQVADGLARYDLQSFPARGQPVERVVARIEQAVFPHDNAPVYGRQPEGYLRQERMDDDQGRRPGLEPRTYPTPGPYYRGDGIVYRPLSAAIPQNGLPYESHTSRPAPGRDDVIVID
ncbi:uncharacterized protein B0T15DRAFT_234100 [Chaetomium strumarium]|uniref:DUF2293 domain-containing protein n=1 Tax=Chaetomium strumarium TaxID=1170767 RepID=A0AAJ0GQG2_9PEZI|nr:hypothetical protein B0T15DRAFT_234100 [Chaetomium strumarium]